MLRLIEVAGFVCILLKRHVQVPMHGFYCPMPPDAPLKIIYVGQARDEVPCLYRLFPVLECRIDRQPEAF